MAAESSPLTEIFATLFDRDCEAVRALLREQVGMRLGAVFQTVLPETLQAYELGVLDALRSLEDTLITLEEALRRLEEVY